AHSRADAPVDAVAADARLLASCPTRRSSDLLGRQLAGLLDLGDGAEFQSGKFAGALAQAVGKVVAIDDQILAYVVAAVDDDMHRSEEHTSELQSRENLVCRLLLEKKNCH